MRIPSPRARLVAIPSLVAAVAASVLVASVALAQAPPPATEVLGQLAHSKAERFARFRQAEAAETPNQTQYDATYYALDLAIDPVAQTVTGTMTMTASVLAASLDHVELDLLANMAVSQATSGGAPATTSRNGDLLTVDLDRTYTTGETVTITVDYSGTPDASYGSFGFDTHAGYPMIWSLSEPFGARSWWPCKDVPSDKADSSDVRVTVPSNLVVASNGTLVSQTAVDASHEEYHWHEHHPIATYLISIAIYPYTQFSNWYHYSPTDSMEVRYYVYPDHYSTVQSTYALTVPMIELYSSLFGQYPFVDEKYGHAEFVWGGGMEHQTIASLGGWGESLIAHELAHQWWGDMITCDDFHNVWLNEGFATYSASLWNEFTYGEQAYRNDMTAYRYLGPGTVYVSDTSDFNRIFNLQLSYYKAAWVLHMLRHVVGDSTFFDCLRAYYNDTRYRYGTATTEEFRDVCETVAGMDLHWFFQQWIYEEYYPQYVYDWSAANDGGWTVSLNLDQRQTNYVFKMPVDVTVQFASGDSTFVVWDSLATQSFQLAVDREPVGVQIDRDQWILRTVEQPLVNPTFHRGVLVVNGVDIDSYGSEIQSAYQDSVFWGDYPITFWDCFPTPAAGYPANLPPPIGHGAVPPDTLKQFSTVVWVGNNYNGDLPEWLDTPIQSYLDAGGNVLLLARMGRDFFTGSLQSTLGITWAENPYNTISSCAARHSGLVRMNLIGTQDYCSVFDTTLTDPESHLLFADSTSFATERGLGAWHRPSGGGLHRSDGARFAFISGRPYRWNHDQLRANVVYILDNLFEEPKVPTGTGTSHPRAVFALGQNIPNPFNPQTTIHFSIPARGPVSLRIYDVAGHLVRHLVARTLAAGPHAVDWQGRDDRGRRVASGVYFYRLTTAGRSATRKMVMIR